MKKRYIIISTLLLACSPVEARKMRIAYRPVQYATPGYRSVPPAASQPAASPSAPTITLPVPQEAVTMTPVTVQISTTSDPYGFVAWLNGVRGQYGLPPVGHDPNLDAWASQNNARQAVQGMGHYIMGPARRQNSAMGSYASIGAMWLASPAHRSALLDPTIRFVGLAGAGAYWTFNAY